MAYLRLRRLLELLAIDRPAAAPWLLRQRQARGEDAAPETWDAVYRRGAYDRLDRSQERHHHRLLAALVAEAAPNPAVLEVGCGEGVFFRSLRPLAPKAYLGVDVSPLAVERARAAWPDAAARFEAGDGRAFRPDGAFDAIVFPECLEYLGEPAAVFDHYRAFLAPGGVIGLSLWMSARSVRLWEAVQRAAPVRDQAVVLSDWGGGWIVATLG